jgi:hypothetical protein
MMTTMGDMLGWHTMGRAAYEANEALVEAVLAVLADMTIEAEIDRYYLKISTMVFNLSDGSIYNSYQAPLHEGDRVEVTHSRPIMNLTRSQVKRLKRAVAIRANYELVKTIQKDLAPSKLRAVS